MENAIASWGIELSLFRTAVGKEFEIIRRLRHTKQTRDAVFFGAYGYFDLAAIHCLEDLSVPSLLPLNCDVIEASPFRFFADNSNHSRADFHRSLKSWKTAVAIFLKITPAIFLSAPNRVRWQVAQLMRERFPGSHVFFGLGFSEILVLVGGDNLPKLLTNVTNFRNATEKNKALKKQLQAVGADSFFIKTATFPFVSHDKIHRPRKYDLLKGNIYPVVTLSCDPASEKETIRMLPPGTEVRNVYGDTDLIFYWKNGKIPFAEFAKSLTHIRNLAGITGSVRKTTSYLETASPDQPLENKGWFRVTRTSATRESLNQNSVAVFRLINRLEPYSLRASITDLCLRLFSCLSDPHLESAYQDMANTIPYMMSVLNAIADPKFPKARKREAHFELSFLCDLARIAINQRYAGLETHPETLAHSQSPVLSDIRSFIFSSSCLPHFIFSNLFPGASKDKIWSGYVIFGTTYSHQWYPQDILAFPSTAIYDPISEWWKVTHEAAHAVFKLLEMEKNAFRRACMNS